LLVMKRTLLAYRDKSGREENHGQKRDLLHDGTVPNGYFSVFDVRAAKHLDFISASAL
jgi:hypothetical protein